MPPQLPVDPLVLAVAPTALQLTMALASEPTLRQLAMPLAAKLGREPLAGSRSDSQLAPQASEASEASQVPQVPQAPQAPKAWQRVVLARRGLQAQLAPREYQTSLARLLSPLELAPTPGLSRPPLELELIRLPWELEPSLELA